jgi:hypothetical protein
VFFPLKELSAKAKHVHTELARVLAADAIACSTMIKYLRKYVILQNEPEAQDRAEDREFSITDNAILEALEMIPFASIRQVARMTFIPPATVFRRLTKSHYFVLKQLCWVPHRLSDPKRQARVIMSKE